MTQPELVTDARITQAHGFTREEVTESVARVIDRLLELGHLQSVTHV